MGKWICNPLDLEYRYQYRTSLMGGYSLAREAADPTLLLFRDTYYLFASMSGGFWYSDDLADWKFKETPELPIYDYAPDVRSIGGRVVFSASRRGPPPPAPGSIRSEDVCSIMLVRKAEESNPEYIFNKEASAVTNWFDQEIDPGCYSISDTLAELRSNPEAGAIIDRMMAQASASRGDVAESVKDNPALQRMMGRMTLVSLLKQAGNIDEESIKQLNRVLQGIRKTN